MNKIMRKVTCTMPKKCTAFNLIGLITHKLKDEGHGQEMQAFITDLKKNAKCINRDIIMEIASKYIEFK